jgi:hypothetical protein
MTWAAHDTAFWNPGDRTIRPDHVYVADAIEAMLLGQLAAFLAMHRPGRRHLSTPPRGPVAVVHAGEWGDQDGTQQLLEQRGYVVSTGDPEKYPHGAKEALISNPALAATFGPHEVYRLAGPTDKGRRAGRRGFVHMPPKYLHLRRYRNLATGAHVQHGVIHYPPSVTLNAERVRDIARTHARYMREEIEPGSAVVGGDFNMSADHRLATALRDLRDQGWISTQKAFGAVDTFVHGGGNETDIDWALFRPIPDFRARGQVVVDMPGEETGKGGEHWALFLEADVRAPAA